MNIFQEIENALLDRLTIEYHASGRDISVVPKWAYVIGYGEAARVRTWKVYSGIEIWSPEHMG